MGEVIGFWDYGLVECLVVWVLELDVFEAFVRLDEAVANDLDLWLMWNGLEVRMEDAFLSIQSLSVTIRCGLWVEFVRQSELGLGRYMRLVLEDNYLVSEESISDNFEVLF